MDHPSTLAVIGPQPVPDVSPNQKASSSSSRHYAKLLSASTSRSLVEPLAAGQLNCRNHPFFVGLFPLLGDMDPFMIGSCPHKALLREGYTFRKERGAQLKDGKDILKENESNISLGNAS